MKSTALTKLTPITVTIPTSLWHMVATQATSAHTNILSLRFPKAWTPALQHQCCVLVSPLAVLFRAKIGSGRMVGIVGIGGLGYFGILFAAALGAEVYAISYSPNKKADAKALGAEGFICTKNKGWNLPWRNNFDFILNTTDATDPFDMTAYFSLRTINGTFHTVGISDKEFPPLGTQDMMGNGSIAVSHIGSSWVETIDIGEEGCKTAVEKVYNGDVRYRVTLVGYDKVFGNRE
ncbi:hypothetical protein PMG11_01944 [Penicillium brasilianum]|uniref:Alcohol dehydrogenase-like C-terminal domain-containing protein n=1 Tax=Penicillium brasilianum TaxID=104259 RepID=A0A0F7TJQ9_PENBI|nr:hypothetical protein PMG11_01944 [Penicillium brasilianum]